MKKILFTLTLILILLSAGCISTTPDEAEVSPINENETETLEYDGVDLTPIDEQRNNAIKGTQYLYPDDYRLEITGMVNETTVLTYDDILSYPSVSKAVPLDCVEGWGFAAKWTGVKMETLLDDAGLQEGATTVIFYSEDGYSTALELDYLLDKNIIVAYKINDVTLPHDRGFPLQLVAEGKYGYKWAKWIVKIEVTNEDYQGYWESRGYNNNADVGGPRFG
ncbi:DMSO/TMAO reductase YedYZ molybdopterin-dependent catalytic subunit [Methanohalophilus levihalophilus]|uniref:molybdopterin-dependent oxidoreductase n=1 Tax=Methanohalophilus levihalophilus TaxID=1431282 RepID=UPI001AE22056|nr:molybdopterin-dependent oxidoreductase [Methanohalophilus levihalophilus]MBP2029719.1 DMSO/TMAO reductase YedYZ molybdopterin-dependent catalytic subunit [Methanohalophilus levihalophilus]